MPREYHRSRIEQRLQWLERAVAADPRLPVPPTVRLRQRAAYLRRIRADYER